MPDETTPNLALPYIIAAQAQKHVTHNEAIRALDALVQLSVADRDLATPPPSPLPGQRYIVGPAPSGGWASHAGKIAAFQDGTWEIYTPQTGWTVWVADENVLLAWNGTTWIDAGTAINPAPLIGVNATADATNRLAVKSNAVLFSHDDVTPGTGDMRVVYNKQSAAKTAAFLFQTGFSGRAEVGTAGDDNLHVKVSSNGSTWVEKLHVSTTGVGIGGQAIMPFDIFHGGNEGFSLRRTEASNWNYQGFYTGGARRGVIGADPGNALTVYSDSSLTIWTGGGSRVTVEAAGTVRPSIDNSLSFGSSSFRWSSIWAANGLIQTSDARDKQVHARIGGGVAGGIVDTIEPVTYRWTVGGQDLMPSDTEVETTTEPVIEIEIGEVLEIVVENGKAVERTVKRLHERPVLETLPVVGSDGQVLCDAEGRPRTHTCVKTRTVTRPKLVARTQAGKRLHAGFLAQDVKTAIDAAGLDLGLWGLDDKSDPDSRQWLRPDELLPILWAALRETRAELAALKSGLKSP